MPSDNNCFAEKAADIVGLYLHSPQHAAVFCVNEKTARQVLDRPDQVFPTSPRFEDCRHGTLSLYAAFNTRAPEASSRSNGQHASADFVAFLTDVALHQPRGGDIYVIADNLSAHKTIQVNDFLAAHGNVHLHFTPTYSSWLKQVGLWFSNIELDNTGRATSTSISDLKRKLMGCIRHYSKYPKTLRWKYFDSTSQIDADSVVIVH